jgi:spermidine/putrescine transport system ATP-binding protein
LLDEPLSALDANLVVRMQGVLSRLQKDLGITFIYVTHSQSEAFAMADRVVIMSKGRIEQVGTPRDVYRQPASRFVAEFVGSNNIVEGTIDHVEQDRVLVDTRLGPVVAVRPDNRDFTRGQSVELVLSADNLEPTAVEPESVNRVACRVVSEEFIGTVVTLLVEAPGGTELRIQKQQRDMDQISLEEDSKLWISWSPTSVYVLP